MCVHYKGREFKILTAGIACLLLFSLVAIGQWRLRHGRRATLLRMYLYLDRHDQRPSHQHRQILSTVVFSLPFFIFLSLVAFGFLSILGIPTHNGADFFTTFGLHDSMTVT